MAEEKAISSTEVMHRYLSPRFQSHFCTFSHQKTAFFTSFCTAHFDIQEITLTFTFQDGATSREWC